MAMCFCSEEKEGPTGNLLLLGQLPPGALLLLFEALISGGQHILIGPIRQRGVPAVDVHWLGHVYRLRHLWVRERERDREAGSRTCLLAYEGYIKGEGD